MRLTKSQREALATIARNGLNRVRRPTARRLKALGLIDETVAYDWGRSNQGVVIYFLTAAGQAALKGGD
jgi:hypothetical protein